MRRVFLIGIFSVSAFALGACGGGKDDVDAKANAAEIAKDIQKEKNPAKKAVKVYLAEMGSVADALETVDSEESARHAAQTIAKAVESVKAVTDALDDKDVRVGPMLIAANAREFSEVQIRFAQEVARISEDNPKWWDIISDELDEMPQIGEDE